MPEKTATSQKRVGLFLCGYSFGSSAQIANSALVLAERGYEVDIFLYQTRRNEFVTFTTDRIHVFIIDEDAVKLHPRLQAIIRTFIALSSRRREYLVIPASVVKKVISIAVTRRYSCFIGIEANGLILAGMIGEALKIPVMYHSLELYTSGHPLSATRAFRTVKQLERKYHQKCIATIIQDEERAELLKKDNHVTNPENYYVPVSLLGEPIRSKTTWLHDKLGIPAGEKIVLQFGRIHGHRLSDEVIKAAQDFPDEWAAVMHGWASDEEIAEFQRYNTKHKVFFSRDLVPINQITNLVASADIGLVFYLNDCANNLLIGSSSEKLAYYLKCGLPVITNDFPSLKRIITKYNCGICVSSPNEIIPATRTLLADYHHYRENALTCYKEHYEFSKHFSKVIERIDRLPTANP